jgi:multiple sugar transport system permease protein
MAVPSAPPKVPMPSAPSPRELSPPRRGRRGRKELLVRLAYVVPLLLALIAFLWPFIWLVGASLRTPTEVFSTSLVPAPLRLENFVDIWTYAPLLTWLGNSFLVGVAAALSVTLSSAFIAFGFAYFRFPGRNLAFGLVLVTMMLPFAVTMVPTYLIWNSVNLTDTQVPLWAQNLFGSAFYIFLIRQFFLTVPREYFEAAMVDGAGYLTMFRRIALPLIRPALVICFVFEFKASWTDLVKPLIYLQSDELYTLPRGLKVILDEFGQGASIPEWNIVMAASVISTIPMIILFFLGQRYFVEGIVTTGRKG